MKPVSRIGAAERGILPGVFAPTAALAVPALRDPARARARFRHANLALRAPVDRVLRLVLVTPDVHRVRHPVHRAEHDSNYGFRLSLWDRNFRTDVPEPKAGQDEMTAGQQWQDDRPAQLGWLLALPCFPR